MPVFPAHADCQSLYIPSPPTANTTHPLAPFFIDLSALTTDDMSPRRYPHNPHYPPAHDLPDRTVQSDTANGNFVLGPTHPFAPEFAMTANVPSGRIVSFTMESRHSVLFNPGIVRDDPDNCPNGAIYTSLSAPGDPSNLRLTESHSGPWIRRVDVYVNDAAADLPVGQAGAASAMFFQRTDGNAKEVRRIGRAQETGRQPRLGIEHDRASGWVRRLSVATAGHGEPWRIIGGLDSAGNRWG